MNSQQAQARYIASNFIEGFAGLLHEDLDKINADREEIYELANKAKKKLDDLTKKYEDLPEGPIKSMYGIKTYIPTLTEINDYMNDLSSKMSKIAEESKKIHSCFVGLAVVKDLTSKATTIGLVEQIIKKYKMQVSQILEREI